MKAVSQRQYVDAFNNEGGDFALWFEDASTRLTIPWCNIVNASKSLMLFGNPFMQGRLFAELFRKMKAQHAHHILHQFASEYYGDSRACLMLFIEYQQARLDVATSELKRATANFATRGLFEDVSFVTELAQQFQHWFDRYCKHPFLNFMNGYNNYSQPLILPEDFMNFMLVSKRIFSLQ
jgi:hypothetical protein